MSLAIVKTAHCAVDDFSPDELDELTIKNIPTKGIMNRSLRRLSSRLAQMCYLAVYKLFEDGNVNNNIPVVFASSISEMDSGQALVYDICSNNGVGISPTQVQNSVYNAPAGFLSIGFDIKTPVLTFGQSYLSWEASLEFVETVMLSTNSKECILVTGDMFNIQWARLLEKYNERESANKIMSYLLREGAQAMILRNYQQDDERFDKLVKSTVINVPEKKITPDLLNRYNYRIEDHIIVYREFTRGFIPEPKVLSKILNISEEQIKYFNLDMGYDLASPYYQIERCSPELLKKKLIFLSSEFSELALVEYSPKAN